MKRNSLDIKNHLRVMMCEISGPKISGKLFSNRRESHSDVFFYRERKQKQYGRENAKKWIF
ncbi:MAG: hypothetical protein J6S86_01940 [Alphaproteobacteria bacterium]|nr:hypothetical protein [Alphaproteobacteria bacterium]